jgi:hypothetical protein
MMGRATTKITLANLAYNMRRLMWIEGRCEKGRGRLIPLAPALPTFVTNGPFGARLQPATDKMLIAPEATA